MSFGFPGTPVALLRLGAVAPELGHARECPPGPARQLPLAKLFRSPDRVPKIILGFVQATELPLCDAALRPRIGKLPARSELAEDRDRSVQRRQRFLEAPQILQHPPFLP